MKVLIRNLASHFYLTETDAWTPDAARARQFPNPFAAAHLALAEKLLHAFIIVRFDTPACELSFPPAQLAA